MAWCGLIWLRTGTSGGILNTIIKHQMAHNAGHFLTSWGTVSFSKRVLLAVPPRHCPSLYRGGLYSGQRRPEAEEASPQQNHIHDGSADCSREGVREDALPWRFREGGASAEGQPERGQSTGQQRFISIFEHFQTSTLPLQSLALTICTTS